MNNPELIDNILINENACFLRNTENIIIPKKKIEDVFKKCSSIRIGHYLMNVTKQKIIINGNQITYSFCAFKYESTPSFISEPLDGWNELKLAYLLIVEIRDFIIINKKNVSKIQSFTSLFDKIDYTILANLFINNETKLEKFGLRNLDVSDKSIRGKSVEALDLKDNFSSLGANHYFLNSVRIKNQDEKISVLLGTSKVNRFGPKCGIHSFCHWSQLVVSIIELYQEKETFLSVFATPIDYESLRDELVPISVLINFDSLYESFENNLISDTLIRIRYKNEVVEKRIDLLKYLVSFERLIKISKNENRFELINSMVKDLELKLNKKTITIKSIKLKSIILKKENSEEISIIEYLNSVNTHIINFDNVDLVYAHRKLFCDNKLLGNMDTFMKIFIPFKSLESITSEKGLFNQKQTEFTSCSLFRFVEDTFSAKADFIVCDDLSKEWADHIALTDNSVTFYHSKYSDTTFSASAFQDIVGQVQKNLGNLNPQDFQFELKKQLWGKNYKNDKVETSIKRIRKGTSATDMISKFQSVSKTPNTVREVYLVINFISKSLLEENLNKLKNKISFPQQHETIQILWFISSLMASCQELNTNVYICCKP